MPIKPEEAESCVPSTYANILYWALFFKRTVQYCVVLFKKSVAVLEILSDSGCKLWACKLAVDMFHLKEDDLIEDLDGVLTIGDFYGRANEEGTQILFI